MTSFKSANQLLREGKLDDAVAAYRQAIAVNPGFSHAHHNLGEALVKAGRVDEAEAAFRRAVELNPQAVWSLFKLGELLRGQERFQEAVGFLRRAVELKSEVAEFNLGLGAALVRLGSALEEAEACLRRAVELNPFLAEAFYYLGVAASRRQQWSEAVEFYGRGLEVNPSGVECGLGLGSALGKLGRWSEAVERYGQMVLGSGESGEVCFALGQALGQLGRWEEAVVEYGRAVALGFAGAEVRHHLGFALGQLGRWEEAVVEYRLVVEVNPRSAPVRHQLGYGLMQLGRWGEAAVELRRSVELYPGSAVVWQQLGDVLRELGEDEEAEEAYERAVKVQGDRHVSSMVPPELPLESSTLFQQAQLATQKNDWSEAARCWGKLWKAYGDSLPPQTMIFISNELFKLDAFSEAASCLEKVLAIHPDYPGALREQKNQYCYHAYSSWLMETVEGISDWYKADGLLARPDWSTAAKLCQRFIKTDGRKNSPGAIRQYVQTNLLLAEEYWERRDGENARTALQKAIEIFGKGLPSSMVSSLIKSVDAIRGSQSNASEESLENIESKIRTIRADFLSVSEWLSFYDVLNWNGFFKCGLVARQKGIDRAYQQADSELNKPDSLKTAVMAAIDRTDFQAADKYIEKLLATNFNRQQLGELRAYKYLQQGDVEGFRKLWPYEAKAVDVRFQKYIQGKSVAIVGPAPTGVADGEEIDSFDVVIRFNYRGLDSMPDPREYGRKTNISLCNAHTVRYLIAQNKLRYLSKLDFILIRRPRHDFDSLGLDKNKVRLIYESDSVFYKSLNSAPAVLFDLLLQGADTVKLFKSNFYLGSQQHSQQYRSRNEADFAGFPLRKIQPVVANHDLISQISFTRNLWKASLIGVDEECAKVLKLSDEDYSSNLANYYCRNVAKPLEKRKLLSKRYNIPDFVLISHHPKNHNISVCASVFNFFIGPERVKNLAGFLSVKEALESFKRNYLDMVKPGNTLLFNGLTSLLCEQSVFALTKALSNKTPVFVYFHETVWNFRYLFHHHKDYVSPITQLLRKCDVNYLVTSSQAFHLVAFLFGVSWEKIRIVYELVDFSKFNPDLAEKAIKQEETNINLIGAGTLSRRKGVDLFMIISNKLTDYYKQKINYFWYSASQGKFHYTDSNVKESNVQWMPFSKDFNLVLLSASALLLTSRDDPAPLVALEALACDRPVFCFQTTGIREIIPPEFICDSVDDMINKIQNFLGKKDNYPQGFFRAIADNYDANAFCERAFGKHDVQGITTQIPDYDFTEKSINFSNINEKYKKLNQEFRNILERAVYSVDYLTTQIKYVNHFRNKPENFKKVVIVGNSPNVLEKKLGAYIDICDEVIRINNFVTKGYEEFIGSKTTRAFVSFACGPANEELRQLYPNKIYLTRCNKFQESDLLFLRDRMLNKKNSVGFEPTDLHLLDPFMYYDRLRHLLNLGENMWTTTGTVAIQWAIDNFKVTHEIYIYGFSFYQESQDNKLTRYFPGHTKKDKHHDFEAEKNYVKSLIDKKQIKSLSEMII